MQTIGAAGISARGTASSHNKLIFLQLYHRIESPQLLLFTIFAHTLL